MVHKAVNSVCYRQYERVFDQRSPRVASAVILGAIDVYQSVGFAHLGEVLNEPILEVLHVGFPGRRELHTDIGCRRHARALL